MISHQPDLKSIAFIGTGIMGGPMAGHLLSAGYKVSIYTRRKERAADLLNRGAMWHESIAEAVKAADVVITMLGFPSDVESAYFGHQGIIESARPGTTLIDMTTSSPALAVQIHERAKLRGLRSIDAPVTGGEVGAREARLSILVGGDENDIAVALPVLRCLGRTIVRQGGPGAGQNAKLANQVVIAATLAGVCEGLTYAVASGLDQQTWLSSIAEGAARSFQLETLGPKMIAADYRPGFLVEHFLKDLRLAMDQAESLRVGLPCASLVCERLERLAAAGAEKEGTQALIKTYQDRA